jgi:uncharacterized protein YndB with AHSA1/START domain
MTVISSTKDPVAMTLVVVSQFDATPEQVWALWEDARKLERWWGPPAFPATFARHEFFVDGQSRYFMTGPNGEQPHGWWRIRSIDKPHRIEFDNGLAGDDGEPVPGVEPMPSSVSFEAVDGGTRMTSKTNFTDVEQMEKMIAMGMQEGTEQAVGQIDDLLASVH